MIRSRSRRLTLIMQIVIAVTTVVLILMMAIGSLMQGQSV